MPATSGWPRATFFGQNVTITDNADKQENLLVYNAADGAPVCSAPLFTPGSSGPENSVIVANTYGYRYPAVPDGAGSSALPSAPFTGGH